MISIPLQRDYKRSGKADKMGWLKNTRKTLKEEGKHRGKGV